MVKKLPKNKKTITKPMRFSEEDAKLLVAGAKRNGLSESAYVRMLIHQDAERRSS